MPKHLFQAGNKVAFKGGYPHQVSTRVSKATYDSLLLAAKQQDKKVSEIIREVLENSFGKD